MHTALILNLDIAPKICRVAEMIAEAGLECELEVGGGITPETALLAAAAGAGVLVAGSSILQPGKAAGGGRSHGPAACQRCNSSTEPIGSRKLV